MQLRRIPMDGPQNFRDLGGYAVREGRMVVWNRLYRADGLSGLTEADAARLKAMNVRTVVDLRSLSEQQAMPDKLPEGIRLCACPMIRKELTAAVWALAIVRVLLCLMPQNAWISPDAPLIWGVYRNIPFAILGAVIVVLFCRSAKEKQDAPFRHLWLTVVLSFACYIPVVLFADAVPMVGMLMIPKTCAYVWTVLIGYNAMRKE